MVSEKIYMTWIYVGICPFLLETFYPTELFKFIWEQFYQKKYFIRKVFHGAILSTTLFDVKINNVVKQVDPGVECSLYVDDLVIMYKSPTIDAK